MKAIVQDTYGSPDVLNLREIDKPEVGDDEALVRVHEASVDQGVWHLMTGLPYLARLAFGFRAPKTPVPGMDLAGIVEAVGKDVSRFRPGDQVFGVGKGTFAVQIAEALGGRVTSVCGAAKVEMIRSIGADHVIDYARDDFAERGQRYDLI